MVARVGIRGWEREVGSSVSAFHMRHSLSLGSYFFSSSNVFVGLFHTPDGGERKESSIYIIIGGF